MTLTQDRETLEPTATLGRGAPLETAPRLIPDAVAARAAADPDRAAVRSGETALSYGELLAAADRIAARLAELGVRRGEHIGLLMAPGVPMAVAALGIMRAGAAYVPADTSHPDDRIAAVFRDARVSSVVVFREHVGRLVDLGLPLLLADEDAVADVPAHEPVAARPEDPAYLIYTSGSTGAPKGVLVEHRQLAASTQARHQVYPGAPVFLLLSPLAFDSSVAGLWGTLAAGGTVVIAGHDEARDPERLVALAERHAVTTLLCVPSLYRVLLDAAERLGLAGLAALETVIVAGEALPESLLRRHFDLHGGAVALVNEYGPTEATVWASYRRYDAPGPVSIGGPIPGASLYVLDDAARPVPLGAEGELFIGGAGVSRGYFGRPEATERAFVTDPFAGDGARMYRTGDRVRWNAERTLDFLGRVDQQVKIRGNRVELAEVETVLRGAEGVRDAVVLPDRELTRLTAFVVAAPGTNGEAVRTHAAAKLTPAATPGRVEILDAFPVTVNGKVDRNLLRERAEAEPRLSHTAQTAPAGPMAARVAAAWAEVLNFGSVPHDANFFEVGGHSLAMFQLQDALEKHTGTRPSVVTLFRHTTVATQAAMLAGGGGAAVRPRRPARRASGERAA